MISTKLLKNSARVKQALNSSDEHIRGLFGNPSQTPTDVEQSKFKKKKLYSNNLVYNEERRFYPTGLWYKRLYVPTDGELSALNLSREDGEFVFLQRGDTTVAYITKSSHSNRYFLNMASPVMKAKILVADVYMEENVWKGNYYRDRAGMLSLKEDEEYFLLLTELFGDAELLISQTKKDIIPYLIPYLFVFATVLSAFIGVTIILCGNDWAWPISITFFCGAMTSLVLYKKLKTK